MAECNNNCSTCNTSCKSGCPLCNVKGKTVPLITVKSLIKTGSDYLNNNQAYICINRKCNVIYFQEENPKYFIKEEVKVPVWFKSTFNEYIVCYCNNIKLQDVVEVVKNSNKENLTKEEIFNILNLTENKNCLYNNPVGECCDKLFTNAIEFAYKQKNNE
jgi:hypothetical protein